MSCLSDTELRKLAGGLPSPHLAGCERCRARLRRLQAEPTQVQPAAGLSSASAAAAPLVEGDKVGPYLILSVLGRGGMGIVYAAYHPELDRRVALKLLRDADQGPEQQQWLLREAQAMARLSHPNVVTVHDAGLFEGRFYIAMELVAGETLSAWLRREPRGWREVLEALLSAGRGLSAAHDAGLVHRDFKPDNVLVDATGRAKVSDFGIARAVGALDESTEGSTSRGGPLLSRELTLPELVTGTPGYMAPEQLYGEPPRPSSDQFSFCVTTFEALCGRRPFDSTRAYVELGAPPLSFTNKYVPRRIAEAVLRGLAVEPSARFPDMRALLAALSDDPGRRRRRLALAATGLGLLGAVGALVGAEQSRTCDGFEAAIERPWGAAARAAAKGAFLSLGTSWAPATWRSTDEAMSRYATGWVSARRQTCEAARRGEHTEEQLGARVACLERRLDELAVLAAVFQKADQDVVQNAPRAVGRLIPLSDCYGASALPETSPAVREQVRRVEHALAEARAQVGAGRYTVAVDLLSALMAEVARLERPALEAELAFSLGEAESGRFHGKEAQAAFERATRAALLARDDTTAAMSLGRLASEVGWRQHRPDEGRVLARLGEALARSAGSGALTEGLVAEGLGDLEWEAGNSLTSAAYYRTAVEHYERAKGAESLEATHAVESLAWVLADVGRYEEVEALVRRALETNTRLLGEEHPRLMQGWLTLANLFVQRERYEEAIGALRRAAAVAEATPLESRSLSPLANLADIQMMVGRYRDAKETLARLEPLARVKGGASLARSKAVEGQLLHHEGKLALALERFREALALMEQEAGPESYRLAPILISQGEALIARGDMRGASAPLERALALSKKEDLNLADALTASSVPLAALGRRAEAIERLERSLTVLKDLPRGPLARRTRFLLAQTLWGNAQTRDRALALARECLDVAEAVAPDEAPAIRQWLQKVAR